MSEIISDWCHHWQARLVTEVSISETCSVNTKTLDMLPPVPPSKKMIVIPK